jgi:hypothetical protein
MHYEALMFVYVLCRQVGTARNTTYVISFGFSVMNSTDFIFMIHIKIIINKIDVYNIVYFPETL